MSYPHTNPNKSNQAAPPDYNEYYEELENDH